MLVHESRLKGAEARLSVLGKQAVISISPEIRSATRRRFSIAHELGHFELQHRTDIVWSCSERDLNSWEISSRKAELEQLANEFAAALLLPSRFFAGRCVGQPPTLDYIAGLAQEFQVSLTATTLRYCRFSEEPVALVLSEGGHIKWFRGSRDFEELGIFVPVGDCLDATTVADQILDGRVVSRRPRRVPASSWLKLRGDGYRENATIIEQSWEIPQYKQIMSLLWLDEDLEADPLF